MKYTLILFFCITANVVFNKAAFAFQVSPMVAELSPEGDGSSYSFTLENRSKDKAAAKAQVFLREYDANGKEVRTVTNDFLVYPPQLTVDPGQKKNIRLAWVGDKHPSKELAYRLIVQQLPVEFDKSKQSSNAGSVNFLVDFVISVFVRPPGALAKTKIDRVERLESKQAKIFLKNYGNAHQVLSEIKIELFLEQPENTKKNLRWTYSVKDIKDLEVGSLMPGQEKTLIVNLPKEIPKGNIIGDIILP